VKPTLSVCTTNYNHGRYIERAIDAIVSQSMSPLEYLIIDDGSTDDSIEVIARAATRSSLIRLVRNERNHGWIPALNRLVQLASGDYVYSAAADDCVLPGFFERAMTLAARYPQAGVICGAYAAVPESGGRANLVRAAAWSESRFVAPGVYLREYLARESPLHSFGPSAIFRRDCLVAAGGFRSELGPLTDTFVVNAIALEHGAAYVAETCMEWTHRTTSVSGSMDARAVEKLHLISALRTTLLSTRWAGVFPRDYAESWAAALAEETVRGATWRAGNQGTRSNSASGPKRVRSWLLNRYLRARARALGLRI
jgi:glycosyltransferase involved in cell wall biosynthesis